MHIYNDTMFKDLIRILFNIQKRRWFSFLLILFVSLPAFSQEWNLKKEEDGIKIFTRFIPGTEFEEVRCTVSIKTRLSSFVAMLKDIEGYTEWAFNCVETKLLETINDTVLIYYTHTSLPWPANDRDLILRLSLYQDPLTFEVKTNAYSVPGFVKEKEGIVRITNAKTAWNLSPRPGGFVEVDYFASFGAGGSIPAWLINSTITYGPLQSMQKIKKLLEDGKYKNAVFWFVKELRE